MLVHRNKTYSLWFWIPLSILSILSIVCSMHYFSRAFPIVDLNLTMNREHALEEAAQKATTLHVGPERYHQAATFFTDQATKLYIELDAGGTTAFKELITRHLYEPFRWQVRHFEPGSAHEAVFSFTPSGEPYGFLEKIPETESGAALSPEEAQKIAETTASSIWKIPLEDYRLIEASQELKVSKRIDHTFVYERKHEKIGEATFRLRIIVSGDKVSSIVHFVKIPEDFLLRYKELRSANKGIAGAAHAFYILIYFLGCCGIGLVVLMRKHLVLWKPSLIAACIVGSLMFFAQLNQLPLLWMNYDTALVPYQFLLSFFIQAIFGWLFNIAFLVCIFAAAEGLTRVAFKHHPQLWKSWSVHAASSYEIVGRTLGGYLLIGFDLAFIVLMYTFTIQYLGWWVPSDHLINPNILATYFPWLSALATSLEAGFMEECMFRALPLATAALLGNKFGKRNWWIAGAFIVQALVFGAAHATYPTLPYYARLVELIIPSFIFGGVYLRFGLLPAVFSHVFFDLVWFSLPLFVSDAPNAWQHQALILSVAALPLIICILARIRNGAWHYLPASYYNGGWHAPLPTDQESSVQPEAPSIIISLSKNMRFALATCSLIGAIFIGIFVFVSPQKPDAPNLTISREEAIERAKTVLTEKNIVLPDHWQALAQPHIEPENAGQQHTFVWRHGGREIYQQLISTYLTPAHWIVRFVTFSGSVQERAEEYQVYVSDSGTIRRFVHKQAESTKGAQLQEADARTIAYKELRTTYHLEPTTLKEIFAEHEQRPARRDWLFTFADIAAYQTDGAQARICVRINGNMVTDSVRYIHLPEEWERSQRNTQEMRTIFRMISLFCILLLGIWFLTLNKQNTYNLKHLLICVGGLFTLTVFDTLNTLPTTISYFNTSEPFFTQLLMGMRSSLILGLVIVIIFGFIFASTTTGISKNRLVGTTQRLIKIGLGTSLCCGALWALYLQTLPDFAPVWGSSHHLVKYYPLPGTMTLLFMQYFMAISIVLFGYNSLQRLYAPTLRRTFLILGICVLCSICLMLNFSPIESYAVLLGGGIILGILAAGSFIFILRHDAALIAPFIGGLILIHFLSTITITALPSLVTFTSIIMLGLTILYFVRYIQKQQI